MKGCFTTNRSDLYEKLIRLLTHGITREAHLMTEPSYGPWYYQQLELELNYRMTDIQAALISGGSRSPFRVVICRLTTGT
ncbi:hypothetical protein [Phormidium sp. FACHB-1136]|uniref:hypothetical protein n=1 Tax=Phormidium sp. FACHB-1136 TaxID=2692848 RepID=UPI0018EF6FD4|nr:hypothetical protein [Phormidium sp. FACHB-1136]